MNLKKVGTYTVTESWENDATGNAEAVLNAVLPSYLDGKMSIYILKFQNNQAKNYDCSYILAITNAEQNARLTNQGNMSGGVFRMGNQFRGVAGNISTWASAGTTIEIYKANVA